MLVAKGDPHSVDGSLIYCLHFKDIGSLSDQSQGAHLQTHVHIRAYVHSSGDDGFITSYMSLSVSVFECFNLSRPLALVTSA